MATAELAPPPDRQTPPTIKGVWPYRFEILPLAQMFVDPAYQRPLTSFVKRVTEQFDPALVGTLVVSWRPGRKQKPYAIVDGQTRWQAMQGIGHEFGPSLLYTDLTPAQEAGLFERLQTQRRGMMSVTRFKASLAAGNPEALAIEGLVHACGFTIGAPGQKHAGAIPSVAALERSWRRDPTNLERTLVTFKEAWKVTPAGASIRGLFRFFEITANVDDERLVRRLSIVSENELHKRASALKEGSGHISGAIDIYVAKAIEAIYARR